MLQLMANDKTDRQDLLPASLSILKLETHTRRSARQQREFPTQFELDVLREQIQMDSLNFWVLVLLEQLDVSRTLRLTLSMLDAANRHQIQSLKALLGRLPLHKIPFIAALVVSLLLVNTIRI